LGSTFMGCGSIDNLLPRPMGLGLVGRPVQAVTHLSSVCLPLMSGKIEGSRKRGGQRIRWLEDITDSMDMSFSKLREMVKDGEAWHAAVHRVAKSWT